MYTRICDECGQAFTTRYKQQRFCKRQHFRVCEICKNTFEVKSLPCATKTCSKKCASEKARKDGTLKIGREKAKQTMLERYGVEHALQNPGFLAKSKSTLEQHYGVTHPLQSDVIKSKVQTTVLSKYGTDNVSKSDEVKQKIVESFQTKYGVKNAMQVPEFVAKQRASTKAACGKPFALQSDLGKAKLRRSLQAKYGVDANSCFGVSSVRDKAKATIQATYGASFISQTDYWHERVPDTTFNHFGVNWPCMTEQCRCATDVISKPNKQFGALLTSLGLEFEYEKSIGYYSYDICVESLKIVVEINPTYTHNSYHSHFLEHGVPIHYHLNKSNCAEEHGYRCIHVFQWDDINKIINLLKPKEKINARSCIVKRIDKKVASEFEQKFHLQGACRGQNICYGLYFEDALVQVMTFGKPRYSSQFQFELLRICTDSCKYIVGGASKLFKQLTRDYPQVSVGSYCDIAKFSGNVYLNLGMICDHISPPAIIWSKGSRMVRDSLLLSRGYDQLFGTCFGAGTSNYELMLKTGWLPVYDCGQAVYIYTPQTSLDDYKA